MRKLMLFVCSICICILSSFSNVSALEQYPVWIPKPSETENNGWVAVLLENDSGNRFVHVYTWSNIVVEGEGYDIATSYVDLDVSAHQLSFNANTFASEGNFTLFQVSTVELVVRKSVNYVGGSNGVTVNRSITYEVVGFICGGNVGHVDSLLETNEGFEIKWGGSVDAQQVAQILDELTRMGIVLDEVNVNFEVALAYFDSILSEQIKSNSWLSKIFSKVTDLYNYLVGNDQVDESVENNDDLNDSLSNSVNEYDSIESGLVNDFSSNVSNLDTTVNIFNVSDFITTSNFLSTQMTNLFNINPNIQNMIMYSLIMGFAFVLIGIGVKR